MEIRTHIYDRAKKIKYGKPGNQRFRACLHFYSPSYSGTPAAPPPHQSKVFGDGGEGFGEGRKKPFFRKVLPPLPDSFPYFPNRRKRSALSTTETDEKAIAVPAIMGESEGPPKILSTPAAMGRQRML